MRRVFTIITIAAVVWAALDVTFAQVLADPFGGSWKLNLAKSDLDSDPSSKFKVQTMTFETQGDVLAVTTDTVTPSGARHEMYTAKFDGKKYPLTGMRDRDAVTIKRIDAFSIEVVFTEAEKPGTTSRLVVSKDGKILTITRTATGSKKKSSDLGPYNSREQQLIDVAVYDKE